MVKPNSLSFRPIRQCAANVFRAVIVTRGLCSGLPSAFCASGARWWLRPPLRGGFVHTSFQPNKKPSTRDGFVFGGEGGIRTRGGVLPHTRFPGVRLKPLIHLSEKGAQDKPERPLPQSETLAPCAQRSKYAEFAGIGEAAPLQCADEFRFGAAQEGVGGFFQRDAGGHGGQVRRA